MKTKITFTVDENYGGRTVKDFLRQKCGVSSSMLTQLKKYDDGILQNGCHVRSVDILRTNDIVTITLPQDETDVIPVELPVSVLYEDEHLIVFDKAPFMAVHPVHGHIDDTLANACAFYAMKKGEAYSFRAINRLDRDTSGTLLCAKNGYAAAKLSRNVSKKYIAVCEGVIDKSGTIDAPIRLMEGHSIQREVGAGGVRAVTHYKPVKVGNGHTLVEFELETGRTHQIRVHMSHIGHPLAGDDMYGGSLKYINRQALHCGEVRFIHPISEDEIVIQSKLPQEFEDLINCCFADL